MPFRQYFVHFKDAERHAETVLADEAWTIDADTMEYVFFYTPQGQDRQRITFPGAEVAWVEYRRRWQWPALTRRPP
jgi:hypothetical protein